MTFPFVSSPQPAPQRLQSMPVTRKKQVKGVTKVVKKQQYPKATDPRPSLEITDGQVFAEQGEPG